MKPHPVFCVFTTFQMLSIYHHHLFFHPLTQHRSHPFHIHLYPKIFSYIENQLHGGNGGAGPSENPFSFHSIKTSSYSKIFVVSFFLIFFLFLYFLFFFWLFFVFLSPKWRKIQTPPSYNWQSFSLRLVFLYFHFNTENFLLFLLISSSMSSSFLFLFFFSLSSSSFPNHSHLTKANDEIKIQKKRKRKNDREKKRKVSDRARRL